MNDENMSAQMQALREDVRGWRADQTKLFVMVERISTQLEHGDSRLGRLSEKMEDHNNRIDVVERKLDKHEGELNMGAWIWKALVGIGVIAAAVIAYRK